MPTLPFSNVTDVDNHNLWILDHLDQIIGFDFFDPRTRVGHHLCCCDF
jgi:hypothetical protein